MDLIQDFLAYQQKITQETYVVLAIPMINAWVMPIWDIVIQLC